MTAFIRNLKIIAGRLLTASRIADPAQLKQSLAYRMNREAIRRGRIPKKYTRLLDFITGERILELGAAEGVLSLLLSERKAKVFALELKRDRHEEAVRLQELWRQQGRDVDGCKMVLGDIRQHLDLLKEIDTVVAVRSIYYLRSDIAPVFSEIGHHVPRVVLCGNKGRAEAYYEANGRPKDKLGRFNFYASVEGMTKILEDNGYSIESTVTKGDPIVVGVKRKPSHLPNAT